MEDREKIRDILKAMSGKEPRTVWRTICCWTV